MHFSVAWQQFEHAANRIQIWLRASKGMKFTANSTQAQKHCHPCMRLRLSTNFSFLQASTQIWESVKAKRHRLLSLKADAECLAGCLPDVHASRRHVEVHNQKAQVLEVTMSQ